jgi:undecaprenyl-diphosphatase
LAKRDGLAVLALAALWLALAADVLYGGPVSHADVWLAGVAVVPRRSTVALAMLFWTHLHSLLAILVYTGAFALLLARRRAWAWAVGVAVTVPGAMLVNYALKLAVQRTRPVLENPVLALNTYSFPSGHTAAAVAFYGMLAAYLGERFPRYRGVFLAGAAALVVLVAYSRMALGVHYFGDVIAAALSTSAWLVICLGGVHAWAAARPR